MVNNYVKAVGVKGTFGIIPFDDTDKLGTSNAVAFATALSPIQRVAVFKALNVMAPNMRCIGHSPIAEDVGDNGKVLSWLCANCGQLTWKDEAP
jgi:hypothetical protein